MEAPDVKSQIQSVEVTYLVHATEDPGKLETGVSLLLGTGASPSSESLVGHFGNEITRVRIHITGNEAESAVRRVFAALPGEVSREISSDLGSFLDEHSALFLRFDKQLLVQGRLALGSGDPVRMKVKPRLFQARTAGKGLFLHLLEECRAG